MKKALERAETENLELRAARQQRALTLAGLTIARQIPNPTITLAGSRDLPHASAMWDQPIELGGKRGRRIALSQEEQKSTDIDISVVSRQIRRRTREAFYRAVVAHAQTEQSKVALDLAAKIKDIVQQRFQAGDVAELEVIQADVELGRSTADYEVTAQSQKSADVLLAALLNRKLDEPLVLTSKLEEFTAVTLESVTGTALRSNADVRRTSQDLEVEQRRLALAKAQRIPNLDVQAGTDLFAPPDFQVGPRGQIGMQLPLFYHGQGEVAQSNARLELLRLTLQAQQSNTSAQVASAYYDYVAKAGQSQQYGQKIVPQSIKLEEMSEDSYRSGKSNLLTLIDSQRKLNDVRKAYLDSLFAVQSSFAAMEEVAGAPLD